MTFKEIVVAFRLIILVIHQLVATGILQHMLELCQRHFQLVCQFLLTWLPPQLLFQLVQHCFDGAHALAYRARRPVRFAQLIQHGATNALRSVSLELRPL
ncbi:MAG: hypothetical protein ACD_10C00768G0001 [uncultured bacterium]|nr:MAG: hypothetical protein ACD_10C00768G0001 [uncultured bacterium]